MQQHLAQQGCRLPGQVLPFQRIAVVQHRDAQGDDLVLGKAGHRGIQRGPVQLGQTAVELGEVRTKGGTLPQDVRHHGVVRGGLGVQLHRQVDGDAVVFEFFIL